MNATEPVANESYSKFMWYHWSFRLFVAIPALFFLSSPFWEVIFWDVIPEFLFFALIIWFFGGLILVPLFNALGRHHIREPIMNSDVQELKEEAQKAFFHDVLITIAYLALVIYSPILSLIFAGWSRTLWSQYN